MPWAGQLRPFGAKDNSSGRLVLSPEGAELPAQGIALGSLQPCGHSFPDLQ